MYLTSFLVSSDHSCWHLLSSSLCFNWVHIPILLLDLLLSSISDAFLFSFWLSVLDYFLSVLLICFSLLLCCFLLSSRSFSFIPLVYCTFSPKQKVKQNFFSGWLRASQWDDVLREAQDEPVPEETSSMRPLPSPGPSSELFSVHPFWLRSEYTARIQEWTNVFWCWPTPFFSFQAILFKARLWTGAADVLATDLNTLGSHPCFNSSWSLSFRRWRGTLKDDVWPPLTWHPSSFSFFW